MYYNIGSKDINQIFDIFPFKLRYLNTKFYIHVFNSFYKFKAREKFVK